MLGAAYAAVLAIWPKRPLPPLASGAACWGAAAGGGACWLCAGAAEVLAWRAWAGCWGAERAGGVGTEGRLGAEAGPRDWRGMLMVCEGFFGFWEMLAIRIARYI